MNIERIERLIALLKTVPDEKFKINDWTCGTAACAVGWAMQDPWFIEQGLGFKGGIFYSFPIYKHYTGITAVEIFFDLTR